MHNTKAYGVLFFYGVLSMITAAIGQKYKPGEGFTYGYLVGIVLSVLLWFVYGKKQFAPGSVSKY